MVTGGGRGIGRAIADRLVREGSPVAVTYRTSGDDARAWAAAVERSGGKAAAIALDLRDPEGPRAAAEEARRSLGEIRLLVNNAGVRRDGALFRQEEEDWREGIETNLAVAYRMSRAVIVSMMKARAGSILNIASVSGLIGTSGQTNYSAAKAGLIGFTKALAREGATRGVRVNALALGLIDAGMTERLEEPVKEKIRGMIPLDRLGKAEEVASVAAFLLSKRAGYITGQVIPVDGGLSM